MVLLDWAESDLEVLADIDEERTWPEVKRQLESGDLRSGFKVRTLIKHLSPSHQSEFMSLWLNQGITDSWYFTYALDIVLELDTDDATRRTFLEQMNQQARDYRGAFKERESFLGKIKYGMASLSRKKK